MIKKILQNSTITKKYPDILKSTQIWIGMLPKKKYKWQAWEKSAQYRALLGKYKLNENKIIVHTFHTNYNNLNQGYWSYKVLEIIQRNWNSQSWSWEDKILLLL